jgi:hypothetical protein
LFEKIARGVPPGIFLFDNVKNMRYNYVKEMHKLCQMEDNMLALLKSLAPAIIGHAFGWLDSRALIIPKKDLAGVAQRLGTTPEALQAENVGLVGEGLNIAGEYLQEHWGL